MMSPCLTHLDIQLGAGCVKACSDVQSMANKRMLCAECLFVLQGEEDPALKGAVR